jgi:hypothetical protein
MFSMSGTREILNSVQHDALNSAIPKGLLQVTWLDLQLSFSRCIVMLHVTHFEGFGNAVKILSSSCHTKIVLLEYDVSVTKTNKSS